MLTAPRILNDPVRCRFSALSSDLAAGPERQRLGGVHGGQPRAVADPLARGLDVSEGRAVVIASVVGEVEHGLEDLMHGGERIELAPLDAVEQPPQLGVVGDGILQVTARARRRDREHLGREIAAAALVERPVGLEPGPVRFDRGPELVDALAAQRLGEHDRRLRPRRRQREHLAHVVRGRPRLRVVGLVDRDHVGDLHDPGLQRLHRVARARHAARARPCRRSRARRRRSVPTPTVSRKTTSLPDASSSSSACSVDSARPPAWPRVPIERMKTPGSRKWSASRIRSPSSAPCVNGLDGSTETTPTVLPCARTWPTSAAIRLDLPDAGRAGEADRVRAAGHRIQLAHERGRRRVAVLDERDRARERARVAGADALDQALATPRTPAHDTPAGEAVISIQEGARRSAVDVAGP